VVAEPFTVRVPEAVDPSGVSCPTDVKVPPVATSEIPLPLVLARLPTDTPSFAPARTMPVPAKPEISFKPTDPGPATAVVLVCVTQPEDVALATVAFAEPSPVVDAVVASCNELAAVSPAAAFADGAATTDTRPAVKADTATSAMRLRSVFVDMFSLSLVRFRNFLDLARRSFDLLIPLLL
jgi:hypothetical protein